MMGFAKLFLGTVAAIFLAGIIHLAVILTVPNYTQSDLWSQLEAHSIPDRRFTRLDRIATGPRVSVDPHFATAVCLFRIEDGPLSVRAPNPFSFWSVSVFNDAAEHDYSLNRNSVSGGALDLLVVSASQRARLQELGAEELEKRIVVRQESEKGVVVFRSFLPMESKMEEMNTFMSNLICQNFDLEELGVEPEIETDLPTNDG